MRLKRDTKDVIESTILLILGCAEQSAVIFAFLLHGVSVSLLFGELCAVLVLLVGLTGLRKNMSQIEISEKGVQVRDPVRTAFFSYAEVKTLACVTYWNRKPAKDYLVVSRHSIDRPEIEMISHSYVASVFPVHIMRRCPRRQNENCCIVKARLYKKYCTIIPQDTRSRTSGRSFLTAAFLWLPCCCTYGMLCWQSAR